MALDAHSAPGANGRYGPYMWYNATANQMFVSGINSTSISPGFGCVSGYCMHTLPNGKCMQYESASNTIQGQTCSGIASQLWELVS